MAYIGRGTESISNVEVLDNLTFNGSASYTLQKSSVNFVPSSANNLLISISGVVQQGNFSVSGSTITFDTTVSASDTCDWILHYGTGLITTVADGTITEAKLGSNAVTTAKINNGAITSAKLDSGLALGKIGQVIEATNGSMTTNISSTSYTDTGLTGSITPSSTSSKILITINFATTMDGGSNGTLGFGAIYHNATTNLRERIAVYDTDFGNVGPACSIQTLHSPNSTSSQTYNLYAKTLNASSLFRPNGVGSIILMEVLA